MLSINSEQTPLIEYYQQREGVPATDTIKPPVKAVTHKGRAAAIILSVNSDFASLIADNTLVFQAKWRNIYRSLTYYSLLCLLASHLGAAENCLTKICNLHIPLRTEPTKTNLPSLQLSQSVEGVMWYS